MNGRARRRLPLPAGLTASLLGALALGALLRGLLAGGRFLQADFHHFFEPLRQLFAAAAAQGQVGWTTRLANGGPVLGNPLHAAAYPPNLGCLLGEPALALGWLGALHLAWGAAGAWRLARDRGAGPAAAWTAGAIFGGSGVVLSCLVIPNLGWPLAWLPWLFVAHGRARRRPLATGPWLAFGLTLGLLLILAEPTLLGAAALGLAWEEALRVLRVRRRRTARAAARDRRTLLRLAASVGLAVAVALPVVLPVLRHAGQSVRAAGFEPEGLLQWSWHPAELGALVLPELFGDPRRLGVQGHWARELTSNRGHAYFPSTYLGPVVLGLVAAGAAARGRGRTSTLAWLLLLGLLALGRHGPIFPWLVELPGGDAWRYPVKWLAPAALPAALLAARGLDGWRSRPAARRAGLATGLLLGGGALALALGAEQGLAEAAWRRFGGAGEAPGWLGPHLSVVAWAALAPLLLAALVLLAGRRGPRARGTSLALAAVVTLDLSAAAWNDVPVVGPDWYRRVPAAVESLRREEPPVRRLWVDPDEHLRWSDPPATREELFRWERDALRLYTPVSFGLSLAFPIDVEALSPFTYAELGAAIAGAPERERLMLLGAAGVSHVAGHEPLDDRWARLVATHPGRTQRPLLLHRNRLAQPRARIVSELVPVRGTRELPAVLSSAPDDFFAKAALVSPDGRPTPATASAAVGSEPARVRILRDDGDELLLDCTGAGGYLIVSDVLAPGWSAELDGRPVPLFRADLAFRGLALPPGSHRVLMRYRPW